MNIAVLVSGGVDSAVSLRLLQQAGHTLTAFYLKIWLEDELAYLGQCPWQEDLAYVQAICKQADVPLEILSLQREYHETVVAYTLAEIKVGRTPNPDIHCNSKIKFGFFMEAIAHMNFDAIATGHYAQVRHVDGVAQLHTAPDAIKDQTYFLAHLSQNQLKKAIFPIGGYTKEQVRALATEFDLANKDRKDSQGICFLGKLKFRDFIKHHLGVRTGKLVEAETGAVMGDHDGFWFYTIGQRQGLGLAGGPWYVVEKSSETNMVFISRNYYSDDKKRNRFRVQDCHWIAQKAPIKNELTVKIRHGARYYNAILREHGTQYEVLLNEDDQGLAPGQYAVFYDGTDCLGTGVISCIL